MNKVVKSIQDSLNISGDAQSAALITYLVVLYKILADFKAEEEYLRAPHIITGYLGKVDFAELRKNPALETLLKQLEYFDLHVFKRALIKKYSSLSLEKALVLIGEIDFSKDIARGDYNGLTDRFLDIQEQLINDLGAYYAVNTPRAIVSILKGILQVKENENCLDPFAGYGDRIVGIGKEGKSISGQESNPQLAAIAKINTIVAGKEGLVKEGDSIKDLDLGPSDIVVSHYHFGSRLDETGEAPEYMKWGIPSRSGSDFYYISLILHYMKKRGATIVPEGILFRGGREGEIRENIIRENLIDCVISLPPGVFKLTGVATSLLIFNREKTDKSVLMIDGKSFFNKVRGGAVIDGDGINRIIDIYRGRITDPDGASCLVPEKTLKVHEYVLSVNRYISLQSDEAPPDLKKLEHSLAELEKDVNLSRKSVNEKLQQI